MMKLIEDIRALLKARGEHERALQEIDGQVREARKALGIEPSTVVTHRPRREVRPSRTFQTSSDSHTWHQILALLADGRPHSIAEANSYCSVQGSNIYLKAMHDQGLVHRQQGWNGGYWKKMHYALTAEAFTVAPTRTDEEPVPDPG